MPEQSEHAGQGSFLLVTPDMEQPHSIDVLGNRTQIIKALQDLLAIPDQTFPQGARVLRDQAIAKLALPIWKMMPINTGFRSFEQAPEGKVVERMQFEGGAALAKSKDMTFKDVVAIGSKILEDVARLELDGCLIVGQDALSVSKREHFPRDLKVKNSVIYGINHFEGEIRDSIVVGGPFWKTSRGRLINSWVVTPYGARHEKDLSFPFKMTPNDRRRIVA